MPQEQPTPFLDSIMQGHQKGVQVHQQAAFYGQSVVKILKGLGAAIVVLSHFYVIPVETMMRHRFGVRYLSGAKWIIALIVHLALGPPAIASTLSNSASEGQQLLWFFAGLAWGVLVLAFGLGHLIEDRKRARRGVQWHTYSDGLPFPLWKRIGLDDRFVRLYGEPLLCLVVAIAVSLFAAPIAIYLIVAGVVLWVREEARRNYERDQLLDAMDERIELEQRNNALRGKPAIETKGFVARGMQPRTDAERRTLEEMISGLEPDLKSLVSQSEVAI